MDRTVRCLRKYYEGVKLQTLFLYLFGVYDTVCFISTQTIFKVKTEKPKTEKIRGIQGFKLTIVTHLSFRGQGNVHFPCSADHEQDWQPYPFDPYSAICDDH